jgi:hypothetical protein
MLRSLVVVVATIVPLVPARVDAGACAMRGIPTQALTPANGTVAKDGGVVVWTEDAAKAPALTFSDGKQKKPAKPTVLGVGLVVYPVPGTGTWTLDDANKVTIVKVTAGAGAKPLDAPKINWVKYASQTSRRGTSEWVTVQLKGEAPAGAVALVVFDDKGQPKSFGKYEGATDPASGPPVLTVYSSGSCLVSSDGTLPTNRDDKVQLAWLDASGRLSAKTSATVKLDKSIK